jgi:hypothetical protein
MQRSVFPTFAECVRYVMASRDPVPRQERISGRAGVCLTDTERGRSSSLRAMSVRKSENGITEAFALRNLKRFFANELL